MWVNGSGNEKKYRQEEARAKRSGGEMRRSERKRIKKKQGERKRSIREGNWGKSRRRQERAEMRGNDGRKE